MSSSFVARAQRRGLARLLMSTVLHKPWSISVEETNRACSATKQLRQSAHSLHAGWRLLSAIVSFETVRRRVVQTSSKVTCDRCERSVSSFQGCLFSESGEPQFKRGQFIRTGCLMMTGIERGESYEGNMPGQVQGLQCVHETHYRERKQAQRKESWKQAAVQGVMVETLVYDDGILIENRFSLVSELTTRGTTPPLSPISGSSTEQRGYKKVHWTELGLNTLVVSVVSCHERFEFEDEWDVGYVHLFGWLRSESTAMAVTAICRSFTADWSNEKWNVLDASKLASHGQGQNVCEQIGWSFPFTEHTAGPDQGVLKIGNTATEGYCRVHTLTARCVWKGRWWSASATTRFRSERRIIGPNRNCRWGRNGQSSGESQQWSGCSDKTERSHWAHGPSRSRYVRWVEIRCVQDRGSKWTGVRVHCRTLLTTRDESRSLHETCVGEGLVSWPHLLGEVAQGI